MVATYGVGNFGPRSIENYLREFALAEEKSLGAKNVGDVAGRLGTFLREAHTATFGTLPPEQQPVFGAYLAGYSAGKPLAEEWEFNLPREPAPKSVRPVNEFGASWRGIALPFTRLYRGFDPRMQARLVQLGVDQKIIEQVKAEMPNLPINFDGMPLQDAIHFVNFIISTTIYTANFEVGIATCGGAIDIAVISPLGVEWIAKKKLSPPELGGL